MASPVGTLRVDLGANTAQFAAGMDAAREKIVQFQQAGARASASARGLGVEFSRMGQSISNNRFAIQNAAFQVGDFATQIAAGTAASRAMALQLPQLLGGFGPIGSVIAAVAAIVSAFALTMKSSADSAADLTQELDRMNPSLQSVRSGISELRELQAKYVEAIGQSGSASATAASAVVANTKREYEARKQLLAVELEILRIRNQEKAQDVATLQGQIDAQAQGLQDDIAQIVADFEAGGTSFGNAGRFGKTNAFIAAAQDEFSKRTEADRLTIRKLRAELNLSELAAEELAAALDGTFNDVGGSDGSGGGGGSARADQVREVADELRTAAQEAEFFTSVQDDIKQGFLDAIIEGKNFAEVARSIAQALARAALEAAFFGTGPLGGNNGTGLLGGLLGNLISGARAGGGPVSSGSAYVVGEKGPEILVPGFNGTVIPNDAIGAGSGGGTSVVVQNFSGAPARTERSSGPDGREMIKVVVGEETARGSFDRPNRARFGNAPQPVRR